MSMINGRMNEWGVEHSGTDVDSGQKSKWTDLGLNLTSTEGGQLP